MYVSCDIDLVGMKWNDLWIGWLVVQWHEIWMSWDNMWNMVWEHGCDM